MKADSIQFEDITLETLHFVQHLLFERNGTLHAYTEWKYGEHSPKGFRGVVALKGKEPVGCFGLMPKILLSGEEQIPCGWFADWYVTSTMRSSGLGTQLLKEITKKGYPIFFGHPGPQKASKICLQNGWHSILFQSSRRFIISPYAYYGRRTQYLVKRIALTIQSYYKKKIQLGLNNNTQQINYDSFHKYFAAQDLDWHRRQPVTPKVARKYRNWSGKNVIFSYCDDMFPSGEIRRKILRIENIHEFPQDVFSFFEETENSAISYIEIFTTDKFTDSVLEKAGAIKFKESPIVWYGNDAQIQDIHIQGIDRENWLYLAGQI